VASEADIELLSKVDILEPLSYEELKDLYRRLPTLHFYAGQIIYAPSYNREIFFLLLEGRVRIYKIIGEHEFTLDILQPGTTFGEAALTEKLSQDAYAQSVERSTISLVSVRLFRELVHRNPEVGIRVAELLAERGRVYATKMADMGYREVLHRLASLLLWLVEKEGIVTPEGFWITTRYTHWQLATMIGTDRVTVTRAFRRLEKAGATELVKRQIYITDIETLQSIAEGVGSNPPRPPRPH
jgi:CRP/FNR family transcriptional regulator